MNLSQPNLSFKTYDTFQKNDEDVNYNINPFLNVKRNYNSYNTKISRFPISGNKIFLDNNNLSYKFLGLSRIHIPPNWGLSTNHSSNTIRPYTHNIIAFNNNNYPLNKVNNKNEKKGYGYNIYKPVVPKNYLNICSKSNINDEAYKTYIDKCNKVIIFDLDDTLIPTSWLRSIIISKYSLPHDKIIQYIKNEIFTHKNKDFEQSLCDIINLSKVLSHTVVIVTNARSDAWIDTVKQIFCQFAKMIETHNIPIVRTDQFNPEPSYLNPSAYFKYWMSAKKKKFLEVLKGHYQVHQRNIKRKIDFISIGDSEFEEIATYELHSSNKNIIKRAFNIKCQAGLGLDEFIGQLRLIKVAMSIISKPSYYSRYLALSFNVQIKMFA